MQSFWSDPYLWIHLAGIAALPLSLLICLLGFAAGDPILPPWLEIGLVAIAGIAPIAWMQSQKPFCIFSLLFVALRPERLSELQRKLLALFLVRRSPIGIGLVALVLVLILRWIYAIAPIAEAITPISSHGLGLIVAAIGFLASNLFVQVPFSVFLVMASSDADVMQLEPIPVDQVAKRFLVFGIPVNQIVPPLDVPKST
ncbi:MAG: low-complexity tail membrane protein [Leptolyngbya sp. UWPOB_LEPTO1]|uniref:low-complexity tail membrane protein n=1 Tax=Leptolyngbya sp. UWPOB_LEPTO1 TaxID=2815653 RepID=UPI001AC2E679|nr:low-complexity tail membrane protein [Leptolyngbya sp. UWPOB_LEPTO1]MBN8563110.1 low-complexity tail membrane protein [Leptolyngbya sp. UWPOB_LEPTO1]